MKSFNTEWNSSYSGQGGGTGDVSPAWTTTGTSGSSSRAIKLLSDKNSGDTPPLDVFSYWVLSDVFDESSGPSGSYILGKTSGNLPFGQVFGLMTFQGMRKAAFNAFKMLNYLGPKRLMSRGGTGSDGVDAMATMSASRRRAPDPRLRLLHDAQHHRHATGDGQREQPALRRWRASRSSSRSSVVDADPQQPVQRLDQPGQARRAPARRSGRR